MSRDLEVAVNGANYIVDLSVEALTMAEAVRMEKAIGGVTVFRVLSGDTTALFVPTTLQALIWTKLQSAGAELELDDVDVNLLAAVLAVGRSDPADEGPVEVPMEGPDGELVVAAVGGDGQVPPP